MPKRSSVKIPWRNSPSAWSRPCRRIADGLRWSAALSTWMRRHLLCRKKSTTSVMHGNRSVGNTSPTSPTPCRRRSHGPSRHRRRPVTVCALISRDVLRQTRRSAMPRHLMRRTSRVCTTMARNKMCLATPWRSCCISRAAPSHRNACWLFKSCSAFAQHRLRPQPIAYSPRTARRCEDALCSVLCGSCMIGTRVCAQRQVSVSMPHAKRLASCHTTHLSRRLCRRARTPSSTCSGTTRHGRRTLARLTFMPRTPRISNWHSATGPMRCANRMFFVLSTCGSKIMRPTRSCPSCTPSSCTMRPVPRTSYSIPDCCMSSCSWVRRSVLGPSSTRPTRRTRPCWCYGA